MKLPLVLEDCGTVRAPCPRRRAILETEDKQ